MKRRIYKKWLKNPMNKRLMRKFCNPFRKVPPVAPVKELSWERTIEALEQIDRIKQRIWEESMIPEKVIYTKGETSLFDM